MRFLLDENVEHRIVQRHGDCKLCAFCSGDGAALQAAAMAGLAERCIALDALLDGIGLRKSLPWQLTTGFTQRHREEGLKNRITGFGLSSSQPPPP